MSGLVCVIDGGVTSPDALGAPAMNFGQPHRWAGFTAVRYILRSPTVEFVARATPWFEQTRRELKHDLRFEIPQPGEPDHVLMKLGYPPLADFLAQAPGAATSFLRAWPTEVLDLLCPNPSAARYAANSLDAVALVGSDIAFEGQAFDRESRHDPS